MFSLFPGTTDKNHLSMTDLVIGSSGNRTFENFSIVLSMLPFLTLSILVFGSFD